MHESDDAEDEGRESGSDGDDDFDEGASRREVEAIPISTEEELALLVGPDDSTTEHKHFNMKSIVKLKGKKGRQKKMKGIEEDEMQEDFTINVNDERFASLHEDHTFAIDPSNPQYVPIHFVQLG